ncbi:MAG: ATP-binding protein [Ignavibacteriaceae bacterium]|nr:ATP-binding protein [Ignavibacteriaceae bacterium]
MLKRGIQQEIEKRLNKGKIIIVTGARQVGKTTLVKQIGKDYPTEYLYLNCDEPDIRQKLTEATSTVLKNLAGSKKLIIIDEAQRVKNIGITLKLFADELPEHQVIATGSSALELSNEVNEPLTGRKFEFNLFPFSIKELAEQFGKLEVHRLVEERVIFGMYPEVVLKPDDKKILLKEITSSYLFKDIFSYKELRKSDLLEKLMIALAAQVGSEVSYNELSNTLKADKETIAKYIELLEKAFVIFRLPPFSRNLRTEITKMRKIYFYDTGIRNALLSNFNILEKRQDKGALWENFLISERLKANLLMGNDAKKYFWRTVQQQEIDYIEDDGSNLSAYEFTWSKDKKKRISQTFLKAYPDCRNEIVNCDNYMAFLNVK